MSRKVRCAVNSQHASCHTFYNYSALHWKTNYKWGLKTWETCFKRICLNIKIGRLASYAQLAITCTYHSNIRSCYKPLILFPKAAQNHSQWLMPYCYFHITFTLRPCPIIIFLVISSMGKREKCEEIHKAHAKFLVGKYCPTILLWPV
jgi:hypothetical protein